MTPGSSYGSEANNQDSNENLKEYSGQSLTAKDLVGLLEGDVPQERIESLVRQRGVGFRYTSSITERTSAG